jgi:effector-binding domain-containing protein
MAVAVEIVPTEPRQAAVVRFTSTAGDMARHMGAAFGRVMEALASRGVQPAGMPFAAYPSAAPGEDGTWEVAAGFPVHAPVEAAGDVVPYELPGGDVAVATHVGPYDAIGRT